ncbi:MAG TPA: hypothetical protein VGX69_05520 [Solirubrobacteraceae bacterium]|nr:hypothetical protein [Solirubrobacteraceae bacterium]
MFAEIADFNGADQYFKGPGSAEWAAIAKIVDKLRPSFQPSRQAGIRGEPIFDPKATNFALSSAALRRGWNVVPVPATLREFGDHWDAGKSGTLAEWQFSNYPYLWHNVIRTQAVFQQRTPLSGLAATEALIFVTKSGVFPSSESSLYYEQAKAQLAAATRLNVFDVPIRLVGLSIRPGQRRFKATWTVYPARTRRKIVTQGPVEILVTWTKKKSKYEAPMATLRKV